METSELLRRISEDMKTIARDEAELVREELAAAARAAAGDAVGAAIGWIFGVIGLAMLCAASVAALAPAIPELWPRLLLMSIVYMVIGRALARKFGKKLKRDAIPKLGIAKYEGRRTLAGIQETLVPKESSSHA